MLKRAIKIYDRGGNKAVLKWYKRLGPEKQEEFRCEVHAVANIIQEIGRSLREYMENVIKTIVQIWEGMPKEVKQLAAEHRLQSDGACACDPAKNGTTTHLDGSVTCNKCRKPRR
jgi:hypothetical protein